MSSEGALNIVDEEKAREDVSPAHYVTRSRVSNIPSEDFYEVSDGAIEVNRDTERPQQSQYDIESNMHASSKKAEVVE